MEENQILALGDMAGEHTRQCFPAYGRTSLNVFRARGNTTRTNRTDSVRS